MNQPRMFECMCLGFYKMIDLKLFKTISIEHSITEQGKYNINIVYTDNVIDKSDINYSIDDCEEIYKYIKLNHKIYVDENEHLSATDVLELIEENIDSTRVFKKLEGIVLEIIDSNQKCYEDYDGCEDELDGGRLDSNFLGIRGHLNGKSRYQSEENTRLKFESEKIKMLKERFSYLTNHPTII